MRKFSNIAKRLIGTLPQSDRRIVNDVTKAVNDVKTMDATDEEKKLMLFSILENVVGSPLEAKGWQVDMYATLFQIPKEIFISRAKSIDSLLNPL